MNITCGPTFDKRSVDIVLPPTPSKIGVLVSGGIDSAILYYLVHMQNKFMNNRHTILPLTILRKEGSKYFAQGVVDKIHKLHNLPLIDTIIIGDNTLPEEEQVKSGVTQAHTTGFMIVYCGVIEQLPQHMVNWHPIPSRETRRFKTPFQVLNKSHIVDLCIKFNLTDLFAITHSCSTLEDQRCNQCNGCNERTWGFEQLGVVDPGML